MESPAHIAVSLDSATTAVQSSAIPARRFRTLKVGMTSRESEARIIPIVLAAGTSRLKRLSEAEART